MLFQLLGVTGFQQATTWRPRIAVSCASYETAADNVLKACDGRDCVRLEPEHARRERPSAGHQAEKELGLTVHSSSHASVLDFIGNFSRPRCSHVIGMDEPTKYL